MLKPEPGPGVDFQSHPGLSNVAGDDARYGGYVSASLNGSKTSLKRRTRAGAITTRLMELRHVRAIEEKTGLGNAVA
ncbi:hypothetical protein EV128_10768 [Rhizobium azibense]|nr:hypothetical protein EV128_10768 [Rhizobium azibense]